MDAPAPGAPGGLESLPHGAAITVSRDLLVMNRDYPRVAFDCFGPDGRYLGHLYPHHVLGLYGAHATIVTAEQPG